MSNPFFRGAFFGAGWMPYIKTGKSAGWMPYGTGGGLMPYPVPMGAFMPYPDPSSGHMPYRRAGTMPYEPLNAASMPYGRPRAAYMPYEPLAAAEMPYELESAAEMPYRKRSRAAVAPVAHASADAEWPIHAATQSPWPWQGTDPEWTYANGPGTLLAQGLRKVRSKIIRPQDPTSHQPVDGQIDPQVGEPERLWWWGSTYRLQAAVGQLLGRCVVEGTTLWQLCGSGPGANRDATELFVLEAPGKNFVYDEQIDAVLRAAVEREDRLPEILSQLDDLSPYFNAITGMDRMALARTHEFMQLAWVWSTHIVMMLKTAVSELRPIQRSSQVMPIIETPAHGSLPSGHATMAKLTADLLAALLYDRVTDEDDRRVAQLDRLARRIAFNRTVAGVHFPMDSFVGYELGKQLAKTLLAMAREAPPPARVSLKVAENHELRELPERPKPRKLDKKVREMGAASETGKTAADGPPVRGDTGNILRHLWYAARVELANERI